MTCRGQRRVTGMCWLCIMMVCKKHRTGSRVWKTAEDSCGAVKASRAGGDVPCRYCLCQFELWRDESDFPLHFLFPLDISMSEEKGRIYNFHSSSKSSSFLHCLSGNEYSCIQIILFFTGTVFLRSHMAGSSLLFSLWSLNYSVVSDIQNYEKLQMWEVWKLCPV